MPNHLHGIILLPDIGATNRATTRVAPTNGDEDTTPVGAPLVGAHNGVTNRATTRVAPTGGRGAPTLGDVVGAFKSAATVEYIRSVKAKGWPEFRRRLWQRNYYEHVIRDEKALNRIRRYIDENPAQWAFDDENPQKISSGQT